MVLGNPGEFGVASGNLAPSSNRRGRRREVGIWLLRKGCRRPVTGARCSRIVKLLRLALSVLQAQKSPARKALGIKVPLSVVPTWYLLDSQLKRKKLLFLPS